MPPRASGRGGSGNAGRGSPAGRGRTPLDLPPSARASHVTTVGVKRPSYGTSGRIMPIFVNSFVTTIPEDIIHHYDGNVNSLGRFSLLAHS